MKVTVNGVNVAQAGSGECALVSKVNVRGSRHRLEANEADPSAKAFA